MTDIVTVYTVEKCYEYEGCDCIGVAGTLDEAKAVVKAWMLEYPGQYDEDYWRQHNERVLCYEYDLRAIVTAWNVEVQEAPDATANDA